MDTPLTRNRSFLSLTAAQFLGYANDNLFKMIVLLIAVETAGTGSTVYLALTSAVLVIPYLLFSGYAGHLADITAKQRLIVGCKLAEILFMAVGFLLLAGASRVEMLLVVLFLMATHSTFFSPSKFGSVPEMVSPALIARANGILEATRYGAVVLGTLAGGVLMGHWHGSRPRIGLVALAIAVLGFVVSLGVRRHHVPTCAQAWPRHPWSGIVQGLRRLAGSPMLAIAVAGITFFEGMAALVMLTALLVAKTSLGASDPAASALGGFAALGCASGAALCGRLCNSRIDLGITPIAGVAVAAVLIGLALFSSSYTNVAGLLFLLGVCGGTFFLPFLTWLQKSAPNNEKGMILATNNFFNMVGVLTASGAFWFLHDVLGFAPETMFGVVGAITIVLVLTGLALSAELRRQLRVFVGLVGVTLETGDRQIARVRRRNSWAAQPPSIETEAV